MLTVTGLEQPDQIFRSQLIRAADISKSQTCWLGLCSALSWKLMVKSFFFSFVIMVGKHYRLFLKAWWMFPLAATVASGKWQTTFEPEEEKVVILLPLGDKLHSGKQRAPELMQTCIEEQRIALICHSPTHGVRADQLRVFPVNMALNTLEAGVLNFRCTGFD